MDEFEFFLLDKGFRKQKRVFYRNLPGSTIALKFRRSSFSDRLMVDLGIHFPAFDKQVDFSRCQLVSSLDKVIPKSLDWTYAELENFPLFREELECLIDELLKVGDIDYLIACFPDHFEHDKWWLLTSTEPDFVKLIRKVEG